MTPLLTKDDLRGRPVEAGQVVMLTLADSRACLDRGIDGQTRPVRVVQMGDVVMAQILTHTGDPLTSVIPMEAAGFVSRSGRWYLP